MVYNFVHIQDQLEELICDYVENNKNKSVYVDDKKDVRRKRDISTISS